MDKKEEKSEAQNPLVLNIDYYIENGNYVFTEHFLKRRGYCCGNGCRHCPYSREQKKDKQI